MPAITAEPAVAPASGPSGTTVLRLTAGLLRNGPADLRWLLHDALRDGARSLVVDVGELPGLDSTAVASLLCAHRTCRARGGAVILCRANRRTLDLLRRTGLSRVLRVEPPRAMSPR